MPGSPAFQARHATFGSLFRFGFNFSILACAALAMERSHDAGAFCMTQFWYYGEGGQARGPVPHAELIRLLARLADPRRVMIWRDGFEDWKAVEDVPEVAQQLFSPPPLGSAPPPAVREPAVDASDAAEFKNVKPELTGIDGWLALVAFGQVVGILRLLVTMGQYYTTAISDEVWKRFPIALWGEAALNAAMVGLVVFTTVLLFQHSRRFPSFFIGQTIFAIVMPLVDIVWLALNFALATDKPISEFLTLEAKESMQTFAAVVGAAIWIPYVLRSRRVANTFTA
jgi:hypothetical protein